MIEQREYSINAIGLRVYTQSASHDHISFTCPVCNWSAEYNNELPSSCKRCGAKFDWFVKVSQFIEGENSE